ncbi:MAG: hypothetical protein U9Q73_01505 [Nanoarchaeota archaeon]|nr:hypothetical protein [Nanoarchaeota archaeon]
MELKSPEREVEYKASVGEDGNVVLKKKSAIKRGAKSKAQGGQFELRVRKDLEEKGWIVDKWSNNVDLDLGKIVPCKRKFNPFNKAMTIGTGFPDFVCFEKRGNLFEVIGVEVKMNGLLSPIEKRKCRWYLENKIFSEIRVARKVKEKNRIRVEYLDVKEILKRAR